MTEKDQITKTTDGTVVRQIGDLFIDPNQPGDIVHVVRDSALQIPDERSVVYWARCDVNGHSHDIFHRGIKACIFIAGSVDEIPASIPESRLCPVCFNPDYQEPVVKAYDPQNDPFTGWMEY